jgi:hypothetical protein
LILLIFFKEQERGAGAKSSFRLQLRRKVLAPCGFGFRTLPPTILIALSGYLTVLKKFFAAATPDLDCIYQVTVNKR